MNPRSPFVLILLACSNAFAGPSLPPEEPAFETPSGNGWELALGLYGWGAGLKGDIGVGGFTTPVDVSLSDIVDALDMTFMGLAELRRDRWLLQLEGLYLRTSVSGAVASQPAPPISLNGKLVAETTRLTAVGGYSIINEPNTTVELLAGVTFHGVSNDLTLFGPGGLRPLEASEEWIDPVIGFRVNQRINDRWSAQLRADVGGFGVNSDTLYQAIGVFTYEFTESTVGFFGWRHAAVDYAKSGFVYDVYNTGPILGLGLRL